MKWWPAPASGELVWCHFPDEVSSKPKPKPKPRPSLILMTKLDEDGFKFVTVAYGTSQKTNRLYSGEFKISEKDNPSAYTSSGLSYETKFNLKLTVQLPFNDLYFSVPPHSPYGQNPKLGVLHPSMVRIASAAYSSIKK